MSSNLHFWVVWVNLSGPQNFTLETLIKYLIFNLRIRNELETLNSTIILHLAVTLCRRWLACVLVAGYGCFRLSFGDGIIARKIHHRARHYCMQGSFSFDIFFSLAAADCREAGLGFSIESAVVTRRAWIDLSTHTHTTTEPSASVFVFWDLRIPSTHLLIWGNSWSDAESSRDSRAHKLQLQRECQRSVELFTTTSI